MEYSPNNTPENTNNLKQKRELLICELCHIRNESTHNICAVNTDTLCYRKNSSEKLLQMEENQKKKKYLESYLQQYCYLYTFVMLVGGLVGVEVEATLKCTSIRLAMKWKQP